MWRRRKHRGNCRRGRSERCWQRWIGGHELGGSGCVDRKRGIRCRRRWRCRRRERRRGRTTGPSRRTRRTDSRGSRSAAISASALHRPRGAAARCAHAGMGLEHGGRQDHGQDREPNVHRDRRPIWSLAGAHWPVQGGHRFPNARGVRTADDHHPGRSVRRRLALQRSVQHGVQRQPAASMRPPRLPPVRIRICASSS